MNKSSENLAVRISRAVRFVNRVRRVRAGIGFHRSAVLFGVRSSLVSTHLANRRDREDRRRGDGCCVPYENYQGRAADGMRQQLFAGGGRGRLAIEGECHPPW